MMVDKKNMEMAFPWVDPNTGNGECGMTLRDYFAAHAPTMTEQWWEDTKHDQGGKAHYSEAQAAYAYKYADSMLTERNKDVGHERHLHRPHAYSRPVWCLCPDMGMAPSPGKEAGNGNENEPIGDQRMMDKLKGEGETKTVVKTRTRYECEGCGEPATHKHTYLMPSARANPNSAAFGRDDCSWSSDYDQFLCGDCDRRDFEDDVPEDYRWCSTFKAERLPHLFLFWHEREIDEAAAA